MPAEQSSFEQRAERRRREMTARLVHSAEEVTEFDRAFWRRAGHEARFAAAWEMVRDRESIRGNGERQLRLQRSVAVLERRWSPGS